MVLHRQASTAFRRKASTAPRLQANTVPLLQASTASNKVAIRRSNRATDSLHSRGTNDHLLLLPKAATHPSKVEGTQGNRADMVRRPRPLGTRLYLEYGLLAS